MAFCQRQVDKAMDRMEKAVRMMPDPVSTDDRRIVTEAILKAGRGGGTIEKKAPDLSQMSEQEFQAYKEGLGL